MTEDEAKGMRCCGPPALAAIAIVGPGASSGEIRYETNCVGSSCMAWRFYPSHGTNPDDPKGDLILLRETYGYCGLAGPVHLLDVPLPTRKPRPTP